MLYYLFEYIDKHYHFPGVGVFKYISFRAALAIIFSLMFSFFTGRRLINFLRKNRWVKQSVTSDWKDKLKNREHLPWVD